MQNSSRGLGNKCDRSHFQLFVYLLASQQSPPASYQNKFSKEVLPPASRACLLISFIHLIPCQPLCNTTSDSPNSFSLRVLYIFSKQVSALRDPNLVARDL